jgi:C4-dicarboxylate-specific signal transduction histidine kinase
MKTLETITEKDIDEMFPYKRVDLATYQFPVNRIRACNARQLDRRDGAKRLLEMLKENLPETKVNVTIDLAKKHLIDKPYDIGILTADLVKVIRLAESLLKNQRN